MPKRSAKDADSSESDGEEVPTLSGGSSGARVDRRKRRNVDKNEPDPEVSHSSRTVDPDEAVPSALTEVDTSVMVYPPKHIPEVDYEKGGLHGKSTPQVSSIAPAIPNDDELEKCSIYNMKHIKKGLALIFNNEVFKDDNVKKRVGTVKDGNSLKKTLTGFGFEVRLFYDKKLAEMRNEIEMVGKEDHSSHGCLLVAFLTHGEDNGILHATDGRFNLEEVVEAFKPDKVPSLVGKPKIFIFQACRGTEHEDSVLLRNATPLRTTASGDPEPERYFSLPTSADFLYLFSSMKGNYSFRDLEDGSWLIQDLCKELNKDARRKDFVSIVTNTLRRVALTRYSSTKIPSLSGKQQMPVFMSTLTKFLYLFPQ